MVLDPRFSLATPRHLIRVGIRAYTHTSPYRLSLHTLRSGTEGNRSPALKQNTAIAFYVMIGPINPLSSNNKCEQNHQLAIMEATMNDI